jgi:hypothetical protein
VWLGLVRAELLWREGDSGAAARQCTMALAWLDSKQSSWWFGLRALIQARLAMIVLSDGDEDRCRELLADALRVAADWVENPAIAAVIDAIAVLALATDTVANPVRAGASRLRSPAPCRYHAWRLSCGGQSASSRHWFDPPTCTRTGAVSFSRSPASSARCAFIQASASREILVSPSLVNAEA